MKDHAFHSLLQQESKTPNEEALLAAIMILSVSETFSHLTPEEVYDRLIHEYHDVFGITSEPGLPFLRLIYRRILRMEQSNLNHFARMENTLTAQSTAVSRLQDDNTQLKARIGSLQASVSNLTQASTDAYARFQKSLDDLKTAAGNDDVLNAIAADMETALGTLKTINDTADAATTTAGTEDQPASPPPPPPPPTSITITGPDSVAFGNSGQFSANVAVSWSASAGSIDATGLYTPAPDSTVISDVITATAADGTTATKSITITQ